MWTVVLATTLLAATGFASTNLGDAIAGRARTLESAADLRKHVERLRAERAAILEQRSVAEIEAAIDRIWVPPWARPCGATESADSRKACAGVLRLRADEALARRRDAVDVELRGLEARLAALPAVATADPTSFAAELLAWVTSGAIALSARDVYRLRVAGLVIAPSLAGLVLAFGLALGARPNRC